MRTLFKNGIKIFAGAMLFLGGVMFAHAATIDTGSGGGVLLDAATQPSFGVSSVGGDTTNQPTSLGGNTSAPVNTSGASLISPNPATTAVMSRAISDVTNAQTAVNTAQTTYNAAVASGDTARIAAARTDLQNARANLAAVSGVSASAPSGGNTISRSAQGSRAIVDAIENQCSWDKMSACIALIPVYIVYYIFYNSAAFLLDIAGKLFDFTIFLSIDKHYVDQDFISSSWTIIRDFSNMIFIFILLYTGIMTMFGQGNWKRTVINVVVVALLINFSLFFTKVVIDAGNILAVGVYDALAAAPANGGPRELSAGLTVAFQPQKFIEVTNDLDTLVAIVVLVVATIVNIVAAWVFFRVALVFVGRLLAFWALMIASPFAFISTTLPKGNIFGWWIDTLLNQSFVAPVFLFVVYIIMQIVNTGVFTNLAQASGASGGQFLSDQIIIPVLTAALLITALSRAKDLAVKLAGEFGAGGAKLAGGVLGLAGGVALGGAALAGRKVVGGAAQRLADRGTFQRLATSESRIGRMVGRAGVTGVEKARTGTFDVRGTKLAGKAFGEMGIGKEIGKVSEGAKGGYKGMLERQHKKDLEFAAKLKVTDQEKEKMAEQVNPEYTAAKARLGDEQVKVTNARISNQEAIGRAENSQTFKDMKGAQEATEKHRAAAAEATKNKAAAQKAYDEAKNAGVLDSNTPEALTQAAKVSNDLAAALQGEKVALDTLQKAEDITMEAVQAYNTSTEGMTAAATGAALRAAEAQLAKTEATIKEATSKAGEWATAETQRRKNQHASYVESRTRYMTSGIAYSSTQGQKTADVLRAGGEKSEPEKEDKIAKMLEDIKKKVEKEEGK